MQNIINEVVERLKSAPKTTEDYWRLFKPTVTIHINNIDIITTSSDVKKAVNQHTILSQLAPEHKDIIVTYIVFLILA
jgi:hypothetical protein